MKYKLFLSDFDGTLVRADGTISEHNKRAIARYREAGGIFAVVTGRMLSAILPRLKELGLEEGLVVAYQGATVADIATGNLLKDDAFDRADALAAVRALEARGEHIHVYTVDKLYANRDDDALRAYEAICRVKGTVPPCPLSSLIEIEGLRVVKVLAMVEAERRHALAAELARELGPTFFVTCSSDFLVEIMPSGQDKSAAVGFLADYYRVKREEVAAIGDQLNDLPLLRAAGGRFAVANGEAELKQEAIVVPSCEDDGVAYALEKHAMGGEL